MGSLNFLVLFVLLKDPKPTVQIQPARGRVIFGSHSKLKCKRSFSWM